MSVNTAMYVYFVGAKHKVRNFRFESFVLAENEEHASTIAKSRLEQCFIEFFKLTKLPEGVNIWDGCEIKINLDNAPRILKFGWDRFDEERSAIRVGPI